MLKIVPRPDPDTGWLDIIPEDEALLRHIRYAHIRLEAGQRFDGDSGGYEIAMIVTRGPVDFRCADVRAPHLGDRASMFDGPPTGIYVPPHARFEITGGDSRGGELSVLRVRSDRAGAPFVVGNDTIEQVVIDDPNAYRQLLYVFGQNVEGRVDRVVFLEEFVKPGNWCGYPPHKHDVHDPPRETRMEEAYYCESRSAPSGRPKSRKRLPPGPVPVPWQALRCTR